MKCEKCKNETQELFILDKKKKDLMVCSKCLEKSIYKERTRLLKELKKGQRYESKRYKIW